MGRVVRFRQDVVMAVPTLLFSTGLLKSAAHPRRDCAGEISRKCVEMGLLLVTPLLQIVNSAACASIVPMK
jgi:hypothetical protein